MQTKPNTLIPSASWLAVMVLSLVATLAGAEPGERAGKADTDGDGLISREEFAAVSAQPERFDELDSNGDGFLDAGERSSARRRRGGRGSASERLTAIDTDGDGLISRAEFAAIDPAPAIGFDELDANGDGVVDADERAGIRQRVRERLRNRDPGI